eukprot:6188664-Pleurochrysis_carterae.AAC.3
MFWDHIYTSCALLRPRLSMLPWAVREVFNVDSLTSADLASRQLLAGEIFVFSNGYRSDETSQRVCV